MEEGAELQSEKAEISISQEQPKEVLQLNSKEEIKDKKEVQKKLIENPETAGKATDEEFLAVLRQVCPGTNLRIAIEGIVRGGKGALIVVENENIHQAAEGGFKINCRFTPQRLIELSKMDGAIILSGDMKKIMQANVHLVPDYRIPSNETGTRHKAAERTAKMTGTLVIAISERRHETNVYFKNVKYNLREVGEVQRKTSSMLQILEKQRELFDHDLAVLNHTELNGGFQLNQACKVIHRGEAIQKIIKSIEKNIIELGNSANTTKSRIKELVKDVEKETNLAIRDYSNINIKKTKTYLDGLTYDELTEHKNILTALAQTEKVLSEPIRGWRILSKTGLSEQEIGLLLKELRNIKNIAVAGKEIFKEMIGQEKAEKLEVELSRLASPTNNI